MQKIAKTNLNVPTEKKNTQLGEVRVECKKMSDDEKFKYDIKADRRTL